MEDIIEILDEQEEVIEINENALQETDPTVPKHVKLITQEDINKWNQGGVDLSEYATKKIC